MTKDGVFYIVPILQEPVRLYLKSDDAKQEVASALRSNPRFARFVALLDQHCRDSKCA
jgi:hypothetical protein